MHLTARAMGAVACAALSLLPASGIAQPSGNGKIERSSVRVGERDRAYLLYVPTNVRPGQPLVVALHGTSNNGQGMRQETDFGFEKLANQHGFIVLYPDAFESVWNDCRKRNWSRAREQNVDDVGFLREVIRVAVAHYGIDPTRVFLFGFSGGAHMAYRMAWESPQEIAAVASVAGNLPAPHEVSCMSNGKTPRVLMIKGKEDVGDPYDGGQHMLYGTVLSARESAAVFAKQNGLMESAEEIAVAPKTKLLAWPSTGRPFVALYSIEGLGHMVPIEWRDGQDGTALAWNFFTFP